MKIALVVFFVVLAPLRLNSDASAQTIQAIIVGDTLDGSIGAGIDSNIKKTQNFLKTVQSAVNIPVKEIDILGNAFSCTGINKRWWTKPPGISLRPMQTKT